MPRFELLFCLLALNASPVVAQDKPYFPGPIELGNQYPLALQQPSMRPKRAQIENSGSSLFSFTSAWSNTSVKEDDYTVDDETFNMEAAWRHGLAPGWEIGILLPMRTEGGGMLDPAIDAWHRSFGLPRGDRPRMPDDQRHVSGIGNNGAFDLGDSGFGVGSPEVSARYCPASRTCAGLTLGLPAPSVDFGQQALAVGTEFVTSLDYEKFSWSAGSSIWFYGDSSIDNVDYRPVVPAAFAVVEYLYDSSLQFYSSLWGGLQATEGIEGHPASQLYLDVGSRIQLGNNRSLDLMFRENPYPGHGTTDISFVIGFTVRN